MSDTFRTCRRRVNKRTSTCSKLKRVKQRGRFACAKEERKARKENGPKGTVCLFEVEREQREGIDDSKGRRERGEDARWISEIP